MAAQQYRHLWTEHVDAHLILTAMEEHSEEGTEVSIFGTLADPRLPVDMAFLHSITLTPAQAADATYIAHVKQKIIRDLKRQQAKWFPEEEQEIPFEDEDRPGE